MMVTHNPRHRVFREISVTLRAESAGSDPFFCSTSASIAYRFSPIQHRFVADCGEWFVLLIFVNLSQTHEECYCFCFQSQYGQAPQDSRDLMHVIYQCARRWELTDTNPIDLVRQEAGRRRYLAC